jgi:hypothetical protein
MDLADAFWGAKVVMRFRRPHIEAAVAEGKFTEPGAAQHFVETLEKRRDAIGRAYMESLSALDRFEARPGELCMVDLGVHYGLALQGTVEVLDDDDDPIAVAQVGKDAKVCVPIPAADAYHVVKLRVRRRDVPRPPMEVHVHGGPRARVLGLIRVL